MINEFVEFFKYNKWANDRYREVLGTIDFKSLFVETSIGFLIERIVHIFGSFQMWRERMEGKSPKSTIKYTDFENWDELRKKWIELDGMMIEFVSSLSNKELDLEVTYTSFDGAKYTRKIRHILTHLTQHPTYHRGQLSTTFRSMNLPNFPASDAVIYFLENK